MAFWVGWVAPRAPVESRSSSFWVMGRDSQQMSRPMESTVIRRYRIPKASKASLGRVAGCSFTLKGAIWLWRDYMVKELYWQWGECKLGEQSSKGIRQWGDWQWGECKVRGLYSKAIYSEGLYSKETGQWGDCKVRRLYGDETIQMEGIIRY